jgi:cytochrome b6-f complex iron-sulfur subunit
MEADSRTRRSVLRTLTLSLFGGGALWRFLTPTGLATRKPVISVALRDVPANGALVLPDDQCAVVRTDKGVQAVNLCCTHLGCTVTATLDGFVCPCHGSRFGCGGQVEQGPATRALAQLALDQHDGIVEIARG